MMISLGWFEVGHLTASEFWIETKQAFMLERTRLPVRQRGFEALNALLWRELGVKRGFDRQARKVHATVVDFDEVLGIHGSIAN